MAGANAYHILENEPIEQIPFATVTAIPMPHRFYGLSIYDLIGDVQEIKTTLLRQTLNNAYLQNNARTVVVDKHKHRRSPYIKSWGYCQSKICWCSYPFSFT